MQKTFNKNLILGLLGVLILGEGLWLFHDQLFPIPKNNQIERGSLTDEADKVIVACANESYRSGCYEKEIPKLMDFFSMEQAFEVSRIVQEKDRTFTFCHVLGHRLSAQETAKDPSKWKEVVGRSPSGVCSNGSIHGAFQERFRTESLTDEQIEKVKPEITDVCEAKPGWQPTGLQQASCYHALGHLLMYISQGQIEKSLVLCNELAVKERGRDYSLLCYDGTFMQIFQPLEPEDFALIEGREVTMASLANFCNQFTGAQNAICWTEGWPLYRTEMLQPSGMVKYCGKINYLPGRERCFDALVYVLAVQVGMNPEKLISYCNEMPKNRQERCFADAASRMIESDYNNADKAVGICNSATRADVGNSCFEELLKYSTYNYHAGSEGFFKLCRSLPEGWRERCLDKI